MRALTANEVAVLKSRFMAGASGHSQQVVLTASLRGSIIEQPQFPWVTALSSGQAGLLYLARPFGGGAYGVYFTRYSTEHVAIATALLFPYSTTAYGLVTYLGTLYAVCWKPSDGSVVYRTSTDGGGVTWTVEATLLAAATYVVAEVAWGSNTGRPAFQVATNRAQTTLLIFTKAAASNVLNYKSTTNADPTMGWSALATTGLTIPSLGRNYGGPSAQNQGTQRAFIACESKTAGTWVVACESDDGDWHANHMATQGTLGGTWTRKLDAGYGGGLSGGQGANGGLFLNRSSDLIFYVMSDQGDSVAAHKSTDSGTSWTALGEQEPAAPSPLGEMGGGAGWYIAGYTYGEYFWGSLVSASGGVGYAAIGVTALKPIAPAGNFARVIGSGLVTYGTYVRSSIDVSTRVRAISLQKDDDADAGSFNIELQNVDGALNTSGINSAGAAAALTQFAKPNVEVEIYQWHGVVANKVKTFTGLVDNVQESSTGQISTIVGRDRAKKLMTQRVIPTAPQTLDKVGYVRDMGNYVYLNKTLAEVLNDLLLKAGVDSTATGRIWGPSSYVFKELVLESGTLMDGAKQAAVAAGMRLWWDEDGLARTGAVGGDAAASVWAFKATEDIQAFDTDLSDDKTFTRVRVVGKANIGAKYLQEQFIWPTPVADPRGIAYDATTGHVWLIAGNKHLYRLNPAANMAIVSDTDLSAWLAYPDSIDVGPDGHLWIADGFDATLGANANRKFRKVDRAAPGTTLLGPFANPDQLHVRLWHDQVNRLYMDTYASPAALVKVNDATGAEVSRVASPVNFPMGFDSDGQGGAFLTGWEQINLFQIDLAGNIVNTIQQPAKNSNEFGLDRNDLGLYAVFVEQSTIVKYAVAGTPSGVATATLATAIDTALELELAGEQRVFDLVDLNISDLAMAYSTARRTLSRLRQYTQRTQAGAVGNPGLQLHDRVSAVVAGQGIAAGDYLVRSVRSDQSADQGTYLLVMVLELFSAVL